VGGVGKREWVEKGNITNKSQDKGQGVMAQAYNSSYLGGGDQEDHGLRPAQAKSYRDPS
jgi:hypothetical protein